MISKKIKANLFVITIISLVFSFYVHNIYNNQGSIKIENLNKDQQKPTKIQSGITRFVDVEYRMLYKKDRNIITKGQEAFLNKSQPNIIELNNVHSYTLLKDQTVLNIKSNKAKYFKNLKNIMYYDDVQITNKDTVITSETAKFNSKTSKIILENKIIIKDDKNTVKGDKAELNTVTNDLKIFMNENNKKVYGQRR